MIALWLVLAALWGGIWWRLRGGALTRLTGFDPGTGGMRAIAAVGMAAPLLAITWHYVWMMPVLWITWSMAGWGAFQSMGASPIEEKNPVARGLERIGFSNPTANDLAGMAIEGALVMLWPSLVVIVVTGHWLAWPAFILSGVMFAPLYFVPQRLVTCPNLGGFATAGSEWGEVLVGAWVGVMLTLGAVWH